MEALDKGKDQNKKNRKYVMWTQSSFKKICVHVCFFSARCCERYLLWSKDFKITFLLSQAQPGCTRKAGTFYLCIKVHFLRSLDNLHEKHLWWLDEESRTNFKSKIVCKICNLLKEYEQILRILFQTLSINHVITYVPNKKSWNPENISFII